jgi:hypothetical protein
MLDFICLLDFNADSHTVDARLNENSLVLISGDGKGVQQDFWRGLRFDFGDIVSFRGLRCEVREAQRGG